MAIFELSGREKRLGRFRQVLVPNWLWQLTWLRHLPRYYRSIVWKDCPRPGWKVLLDMLYINFRLKNVPEHYGPYRLWEQSRKDWALYYGTPYTPVQRARLAGHVYPLEYEILYNDKVVGAKLCEALEVRQPRMYGMVEPDACYHDRLAKLLASSGQSHLMLKPCFGRSGLGIVIIEGNENGSVVRTPKGTMPLSEFKLEWPVFAQEVIRQDPRIAAIWGSSVNTIRVITLQTRSGDVLILGCAIRFGVDQSFVDNWSAGGVAVGIDWRTGRLRKFGYDVLGNRYTQHPSSQFTFDGFQVPEWDRILDTARKIQQDLPFSKVAGFDICLNQNGEPVLIEINGLPDFVFIEQLNGPLLADEQLLKVFAEYDLLVSKKQRELLRS